jgi:TM2 domain-containing membrane protein YozV
MALTEAQKRKIEEEEGYRAKITSSQQTVQAKSFQKHGVPAILSFFIPGLGQIVKGQLGKGILTFIGVSLGLIMLVIPGIIIWIWQIMDAYNN